MDAAETVRRLHLAPHPEGGFYRESFRSAQKVRLPDGRERSASTAIYYLLPHGAWSTWHRVQADEVWHHYEGAPLQLFRLGMEPARLDRRSPQAVVPTGVWQAALPDGGATLCGCTVAPGFEFEDFEVGTLETLLAEYPDQEALIRQLLR
ncbi:MAG TPA: cupin domain-containing protein [Gemmatimonadales bacterium]|jgi:predicted cupin superfamily sugar epimerase